MELVEEKLQRRKTKQERADDKFIAGLVENGGLDPQLKVDPRSKGKLRLETILHEALHHLNPDWSESRVLRAGKRLAGILWKDRWRRLEETP